MIGIHSRYYCPCCGDDGDLMLSENGEKEYDGKHETNKYHCPKCKRFFKIDQSNKDFITIQNKGNVE